METILKAENLLKIYPHPIRRQKIVALNHLNLEVHRGEIFGLLGPNGSGKTTAMKAFLGLIRLNEGRVKVFGQAPSQMAVKAKIGFLPEESYLYKFLTAQESLYFFGRLAGLNPKLIHEKVGPVLQKVGLTEAKDRWVRGFSKGMLRRLGLAFILLKDPDLIFLDEPTVGLDPLGAVHVREMMQELKKRGKTIIMSSHLLGEIENVCDRIAILHQGQVLREDKLEKILEIPDKIQITLQKADSLNLNEVEKLLKNSGATVESIGHPKKTLEKAFLEILNPR